MIVRVPGKTVGGGGIVGCVCGMKPRGKAGIVFAGTAIVGPGYTGTTGVIGCG
jgi:hypothetical protein